LFLLLAVLSGDGFADFVGGATVLAFITEDHARFLAAFMFESEQQMDDVVAESGILEQVNAETETYGVTIPGFNMRGGLMGIFTTDIPVTRMSDLEGVRLRAQNGEQIKFFESWGAKGTVVSFADVPNALQTGVAQGYFNPPSSAIKARHTDILKNFVPLDVTCPLLDPHSSREAAGWCSAPQPGTAGIWIFRQLHDDGPVTPSG